MTIYTHSTGTQEVIVLEHSETAHMTKVRFESGKETWVCDSDLNEEPTEDELEAASHRAADLWTRAAVDMKAKTKAARRTYLANIYADASVVITDAEWAEINDILASQCPTFRPAPAGSFATAPGYCTGCGRSSH